jgi:hypothetical protein
MFFEHKTITRPNPFPWGITCYGSQKPKKKHIGKFKKICSSPYWIQYYLPNNTTLLVTMDKFDPNLIIVNVNKLIPYRFHNLIPKGLEAQIKGEEMW